VCRFTGFQRIGVDLIGPIIPAASSGKRYVLTAVDYATHYPEAVALSGISTEEVVEALCSIYSRVGIPACHGVVGAPWIY